VARTGVKGGVYIKLSTAHPLSHSFTLSHFGALQRE